MAALIRVLKHATCGWFWSRRYRKGSIESCALTADVQDVINFVWSSHEAYFFENFYLKTSQFLRMHSSCGRYMNGCGEWSDWYLQEHWSTQRRGCPIGICPPQLTHWEAWGWTRGLALEDLMWYEQQQSIHKVSYTKRLREVWRALDPHQFIIASVDSDANFRIK